MRRLPAAPARLLPAALALAACAAAPEPAGGPDEAAAVAARWAGPTPDGGGTVAVIDAGVGGTERAHACTLRRDGSVAGLTHPGA